MPIIHFKKNPLCHGRPCSKNLGLNAEDEIKFSNVSNLQIVMDFVKEIEAATGRKLTAIDIGGGLSSTYKGLKYFCNV